MVGICGLYCGTCPMYLAPRENDRSQLEKISAEKGIPIEDIQCDGCLSENLYPLCEECRHGFRKCAAEKNVTWCFECDEFPCQRLEDFRMVHVVNGISHHENVVEHLRYMKKDGIEKWVEAQDQAGCCPACGKMLYWFTRECSACQTRIR
jgi:hypothetical protein